jgi:hypothetical protein
MSTLNSVINQYMAVWNEPNATVRRHRIRALWTEHGSTCHRLVDARGYDAIEARVRDAHKEWVRDGGYVFRARPNLVGHHHVAKFNWEMLPATGGESAAVGFDVFILTEDGRIQSDYMFNETYTPSDALNHFVDRYVAVWNEPDPAARHKLITTLWSDDSIYLNESQEQHGHRAIETVVSHAYHEFVAKGFLFRSQKNAYGHHNVVRFNWDMVPAHGSSVAATGFAFFVLGDDGRIRCDYQFNEPITAS